MGHSSSVNVGGTKTKGEGGSRTSVTVPIIAQYQLSLTMHYGIIGALISHYKQLDLVVV